MKSWAFILPFFLLVNTAFSQERILSYFSVIQIEESGSILVEEKITVLSEGVKIRRGIFRDFPTQYQDRLGNRYKVSFEVLEVLRDGKKEPFRLENKNNGKIIYIGDANTFLQPNTYTYTLKFRTDRQLGFFENYDELYFNAIGGGWDFAIDSAGVTVWLPNGAKTIQYDAFTGPSGSTGYNCEIKDEGEKVHFSTKGKLNPGDQFTVALAWPKGFVAQPSALEKSGHFLSDNKHILVGGIGLLLTFWVFFSSWKKVGKDPAKGTIIPRFEAPEGLTAACSRYLMRMGFDQKVFTATLVAMAVHGYLTIETKKKNDFSLTKVGDSLNGLTTGEKVVATVLFKNGNEIHLDNKNHQIFTSAKTSLLKFLKTEVMPGRFKINFGYTAKGIGTGLATILLTGLLSPSPGVPVVLGILIFILTLVFYNLMQAPTIEGRKIMDEIEGFKRYLSVTEKNPLNMAHEPNMTPAVFERLLPYAIALGVENKWAEKFEQQVSKSVREAYQPTWYHSYSMGRFNALAFSSSLGSSFSSAISSASTPPGSSSGSGGGGFSGGGGGGGGGGGW
ncbi:hypothetical protein P872_12830 [Rhodonellum psychrophilum GCM71 = DSM 17998]|uniref:DUF2207 domain-containing protein n=2 Tax=Rhodonellum TaxID=336827 RepID=U5BT00_9BACT|nr:MULTISPECIES: DUF2207 domain-containing protein [Rhodonellum]ERM80659.1 hypothetical protein P872_12830 [Rhodonellum psychrophilum GCM71 = DSM 17998]SDZ46252.1 Predicted membrane protein [Rhodonellum ikkaensis]